MMLDFTMIAEAMIYGFLFGFSFLWQAAIANTPPYPVWYVAALALWHNAHSTRGGDGIRAFKIAWCIILVLLPTAAFFAS